MKLAGIDMNLLVAFDVLVAERNVTRAAKRLGLSQPATSNALARLRRSLGDPLLVHTRAGMVPTARGLELSAVVRRALGRVEDALVAGAEFDPKTAARAFSIVASDYGELVVVAALMSRLAVEAPSVDLRVLRLGRELPIAEMEEGRVDLVVGVMRGVAPGLYQQRLFDDRLTCVVRAGHPIVRGRITPARFARLSHVQVAPRGAPFGMLDTALASRGLSRHVALRVPHFLIAALVVAESDLVCTVPERLVDRMTQLAPLRRFEPPVPIAPLSITQVWHSRVHADPAHGWFRSLVAEVCAA